MEWREQSEVSCDEAYLEAQRWIEAVTKKTLGSDDFRSALENGVLLCESGDGQSAILYFNKSYEKRCIERKASS
ncbi:hypothetical protein NQZ68_004099 [Dissostichus eleginoides]|nr:hypothetical protein NQZ68_004099 [Dissostichus eleginoides]